VEARQDQGDQSALVRVLQARYATFSAPAAAAMAQPSVEQLRARAGNGDAIAMYDLGRCYHNGSGVPQDYVQAAKWYGRAADQRHVDAMFSLALCYRGGRGVQNSPRDAVRWYLRAAENGHMGAMNNLAYSFEKGYGVAQSWQQAFFWYHRAAEGGYVDSMSNLGNCYFNGWGVTQDYQEAVAWYQRAAERGSITPIYGLAKCYENGMGVPTNVEEARRLYERAAAAGIAKARMALERLGHAPPSADPATAAGQSTDVQAPAQAASQASGPDSARVARREANPELQQAIASDLDRRIEERLHPCCVSCGRDITPDSSVLMPACLHSACEACMHQSDDSNLTLTCSLCGLTSTVERRAAMRHPLVEAALAPPKRYCEECDDEAEDNIASHQCRLHDCQKLLCETHATAHRKSRLTKTHELAAIAAEPATDGGICPDHGKPRDIYCTTCRAAICYLCTTSEAAHPAPSHTRQNLRTYCEQVRQSLGAAVEQAERCVLARVDRALDVSISCAEIDERSKADNDDIDARFDVLHALLEQRRYQLKNEVDTIAAEEKQRLTNLGDAERVAHTVLATTLPLARYLVDARTPDHIVARLERAMCARLDELYGAFPTDPVPLPAQVTFELAETKLEQAIRTAGSFTIQPRRSICVSPNCDSTTQT